MFFVDGDKAQPVEQYSFKPTASHDEYLYDTLLWHNNALPSGQHSFVLRNGFLNSTHSLVLLDYIIYTRYKELVLCPDSMLTLEEMTVYLLPYHPRHDLRLGLRLRPRPAPRRR